MGLHHLALATRDTKATHAFYTGPMGFELAKVEVTTTPKGGWAKHLFYDTGGGGMIAFWELHDDNIPADFPTSISKGMGLPDWVNHIAFDAKDLRDLEARKQRWLEHGIDLAEVDHGWSQSIYARDPNGNTVEFCATTQEFTQRDRDDARRLLEDPNPAPAPGAPLRVHRAG